MELRSTAIPTLHALGVPQFYCFPLSRTMRYEDTVAYMDDLVQDQLEKNLTDAAINKTSAPLLEDVVGKLTALRKEVFERDFSDMCVPINIFFPMDRLKKIAQNYARIDAIEDLRVVLGAKYDLSSSLLEPYATRIIDTIQESRTATDTIMVDKKPEPIQPRKRPAPKPRKRKYDGYVPEHLLDPKDPKDAKFLENQRELMAYDARLMEESSQRWIKSQREQAQATVEISALKSAAKKLRSSK